MYPLYSIHRHISHSGETLPRLETGLSARMNNRREKWGAPVAIDFQLCRKLVQRND